jgi:preprotein translocase SecE subunit
VEEALPALQGAHDAQRDEIVMANALVKTKDFTNEVITELKKVTWPDQAQLKSATGVIMIFILIVSLIILGMDLVVRNVIDFIIGIFAR